MTVFLKFLGEKVLSNIFQVVLFVVHQGIKQLLVVQSDMNQMIFLRSGLDLAIRMKTSQIFLGQSFPHVLLLDFFDEKLGLVSEDEMLHQFPLVAENDILGFRTEGEAQSRLSSDEQH